VKQREEQVEVIQATLRQTLDRLESTSSEVCGVRHILPASILTLYLYFGVFLCLNAECFMCLRGFRGAGAVVAGVVYCGLLWCYSAARSKPA
jgi:hypothetical protein